MCTSKCNLAPGPAHVMGRPDTCNRCRTENKPSEVVASREWMREGKDGGQKTVALCYKPLCQFDSVLSFAFFVMKIIIVPSSSLKSSQSSALTSLPGTSTTLSALLHSILPGQLSQKPPQPMPHPQAKSPLFSPERLVWAKVSMALCPRPPRGHQHLVELLSSLHLQLPLTSTGLREA